MNEEKIFEHLFMIFELSDDDRGVVASCLVRSGEIVSAAVSMSDGVHAEYALLQKLNNEGITIEQNDLVYTTLEPCGKRTPGGKGEKMGDCTTNLINANVKHVVYAASDPEASAATRHKFADAGVELVQVSNSELVKKAIKYFNVTCNDPNKHLPL